MNLVARMKNALDFSPAPTVEDFTKAYKESVHRCAFLHQEIDRLQKEYKEEQKKSSLLNKRLAYFHKDT